MFIFRSLGEVAVVDKVIVGSDVVACERRCLLPSFRPPPFPYDSSKFSIERQERERERGERGGGEREREERETERETERY